MSKDRKRWVDRVFGLMFVPIAIGYAVWGLGRADGALEVAGVAVAMILALAVHIYAFRHDENPFEAAAKKMKERFRQRHFPGD